MVYVCHNLHISLFLHFWIIETEVFVYLCGVIGLQMNLLCIMKAGSLDQWPKKY